VVAVKTLGWEASTVLNIPCPCSGPR